ncbi:MAG: hypothetical protein QW685_06355 [Saccharolobus sp.]
MLNAKIANILNENFGLDCRTDQHIKCFYNGFRILITISHDRNNSNSLPPNSEIADFIIILHSKEEDLTFNATIITNSSQETLTNIKLENLVNIIKQKIEEKEIQQEIKNVKQVINNFIKEANNVSNKIAEILYKLYGFEIAEAKNSEIILGQAALSILLSSLLYEKRFHKLSEHIKQYGPINGLQKALEEINYEPLASLTIDILKLLPPNLNQQVNNIINTAIRIAKMKNNLLSRDLAGRIYHEITGNITVKKGFATYYTEIPAAYLLSNLAIISESLVDTDIKIIDFACGSGTLLTACLYNASRIAKYNRISIYGIDALKYATQITALNLELMTSEKINNMTIITLPVGIKDNKPTLGSLELIDNTLEELPNQFHIVIMNPPFTRATGRKSKEFKEKGLFGFITDKKNRQLIKKRYEEIRKKVKNELEKIAKDLIDENVHYKKQYLNIGQAGTGLLFLYLAYKYTKPNGVIAFVLPRNLLSGVSWFLARALLAKEFHVKYIIISNDPEKGYNFSENTGLSECLVVAKKIKEQKEDQETIFINLLKKPKSATEAIVLSEKIINETLTTTKASASESANHQQQHKQHPFITTKVNRKQLLENIDNWNKFVFLPDNEIIKIGLKVLEGDLLGVKIPITRLENIIQTIGIDSHQFHDNFTKTNTITPYPILYGGEEKIRQTILTQPNAYAKPKTNKAKEIFQKYSGKILVPDRIPITTTHTIALYSTTPTLSNTFYSIKTTTQEAEKTLAYWLNTTWGLLSIIAYREETWGTWIRLKITQWKQLPVININKLDNQTIKTLSLEFDKIAKEKPKRIPQQFTTDPIRLKIDLNFLKALNIDENQAKQQLQEIYKRIEKTLKTLA